jgi:hypothetical protein
MGAVEFIIACHIVQPHGQHGNAVKHVIQPGGVIADEKIGAFFLPEVLFKSIMHMIFLIHEKTPHCAENVIEGVGLFDFSGVDLFFNGKLCHRK